jgi:sugar lactone lactonase YvrE
MWIGTFRGLVRWADGRLLRGPPPLDSVAVHSIAQDASGALWFATDKGLLRLRDGAVEAVGADRLAPGEVAKVLFDRDRNLWIGMRTGVARMTPDGEIERLPAPDVLVNALFEDADGNLWIGSDRGLDRLSDGDVIPFGVAEGLTDEVVAGFREDATGAKWITTFGGLYRIAPGQSTATRIAAHRGQYAIYPDSRGTVWFGGRDGNLGTWRDGRLSWIGNQDWERTRSLTETADGLWLGTDHGLFRMRGDRPADAVSVVPGVAVRSIVTDTEGSLWIATEDRGLMHWRAGAVAAIPPGGPPLTMQVTTILFDSDGTMWVGTGGAGLWRLRHGLWSVFTAKDGMFDDAMWWILDDQLGHLWMSSNRGIWRVSRQQLDAFAAKQRATVDSQAYGEADGMRDRECNGVADPAGWRTGDGRLWFPTGKGLAVIDPAHLHERKPPRALIESVLVNGQPQPLAGTLVLPAGGPRLEVGYTAPALRGPERLRFRYRLEGFEPDWNYRTPRVAQYTNVPPGDYTFIVAAGLDNKWGQEAVLAMTVPPLFYKTGWFRALVLLSLALAIAAVPMLRVRQLRRQARALDKRVQEAIGELKVLSGMLPICAWCKKIRDDGGYWSQIEAYLSERTDARFTHGICPECRKKMLADENFRGISRGPHE